MFALVFTVNFVSACICVMVVTMQHYQEHLFIICHHEDLGQMTIITSTINAYFFIEILDNVLISFINNWFGNEAISSG